MAPEESTSTRRFPLAALKTHSDNGKWLCLPVVVVLAVAEVAGANFVAFKTKMNSKMTSCFLRNRHDGESCVPLPWLRRSSK